jgi:3-isopropylmalate/(R)-2-methylmalate dehydratase small subunit
VRVGAHESPSGLAPNPLPPSGRGSKGFTVVTGIAAALHRENIDTDIIIPSREITSPAREGFGPKAFAPWRYTAPGGPEDPSFVLNRGPWRQAVILIAGANFGCGSSREMAVWALAQFGLRCVIAPSFGAIFQNNCVRNALLPVVLPAATVAELAALAADEAAPLVLTIDLEAARVRRPDGREHAFELEAMDREMLLTGLDAIDRTWQQHAAIVDYEARDRIRRPWAWS